ncbi:hypothetical protein F2Q68_00031878 [Brassica cretica]|uniref:Uncharacterized protein n=1 Tax=Brassica cretica TaxID=69181 RepID=A0A8S9GEN4_BRACR|nr:hypothetical protein F2Q68_00031878 [Brassica cretica]
MVLENTNVTGNDLSADPHVLPATQISFKDSIALSRYISQTKKPIAHINPSRTVLGTKPAPVMAAFLSKGPSSVAPEILKPDITAPGMVLENTNATGNDLTADSHVLPATQISFKDSLALSRYISQTKKPIAHITPSRTVLGTKPAPVMAAFLSKGPSSVAPEILKPDITAPGVSVVAADTGAVSPTTKRSMLGVFCSMLFQEPPCLVLMSLSLPVSQKPLSFLELCSHPHCRSSQNPADPHVLPATQISFKDSIALSRYISQTKKPIAHINPSRTVLGTKPAPVMAAFLSKGPSSVAPEILKPDITAPGVSVVAAYTGAVSPTTKSSMLGVFCSMLFQEPPCLVLMSLSLPVFSKTVIFFGALQSSALPL